MVRYYTKVIKKKWLEHPPQHKLERFLWICCMKCHADVNNRVFVLTTKWWVLVRENYFLGIVKVFIVMLIIKVYFFLGQKRSTWALWQRRSRSICCYRHRNQSKPSLFLVSLICNSIYVFLSVKIKHKNQRLGLLFLIELHQVVNNFNCCTVY